MNTADIRTRFAYNRWANRRLLGAAKLLPSDDFSRDLRASFGSLRGTFLHILWGECGWLQFWRNGSFTPELRLEDFPDVLTFERYWATVEQEQLTFAQELTESLLAAYHTVGDQAYKLEDLIQHLLNHSTYHRGQVALLLRQLGQTPPATDYRRFLAEAP